MKPSEQTRHLLISHYKKYPDLEIDDILKFIFQSTFGCEHMISSGENAVMSIKEELSRISVIGNAFDIQYLDGNYCRVPLSYLNNGLDAHTLGKLFYMSAKQGRETEKTLIEKLDIAKELVRERKLPFSETEFQKAVKKWEKNGYQALHHSDAFRKKYQPSYRVISNEFISFLPLFTELDNRLRKGTVKIAVEGGSGSGKTTLSRILNGIYDCTVFHMDDFFLRPEQRTAERYAQVGGNIDKERFLEEVLIPLSNAEVISYRRFDCSEMKLIEPVRITPGKLTVIEGAYSMHPEFSEYYDFSVFLDISSELQKIRIENRNSPSQAKQFFDKWIPFENRYFSEMKIKEKCDMNIAIE